MLSIARNIREALSSLPWLITLGVFAACILAIQPWGNYPLNDDWQYARAVKLFVESGTLRIDTPIAPALVGQVLLAYPVVRYLGMNHAFLRALTWVITGLCLLCVDRLLHLAGVSPSRRLFALLVLLLNPLFFYFANTFMTEMYGYFPALLAAVVYFEYRRRSPVASRSRELQWWIGIALLSVASFWIRQFSALVFPAIVVCWIFTVPRPAGTSRWKVWVSPVVSSCIFAMGLAGYFVWVRASGNFGFAFGDPLGRMVQLDGLAWTVGTGTVLVYLTGFFAPMLVLISGGRGNRIVAGGLGVLCVGCVLLTRGWLQAHAPSDYSFDGWTHRVFPYVTNVIFRTGLGPITLDDVYHHQDAARPHGSAQLWTVLEWTLLAGTFLWGFVLQKYWARGKVSKGTLEREVAFFTLLWAVISWIATVQAYPLQTFDRYYFPLVLTLSILLPLLFTAHDDSGRRLQWRKAVAAICLSALGWFSVAGMHDHFRWNDARWNLARFAFSQGVAPSKLAAGFEVNGWENYDNSRQTTMSPSCREGYDDFFCSDATYRIGMSPKPGYTEWKLEQPRYWLADGPPVRLLRRQ